MIESETKECLEVTKDTARKVDDVIKAYNEKDRQCDVLGEAVKWLCRTLMVFILCAAIVSGIFVYGYMFSANTYAGDITQSSTQDSTGNTAQVVR